MKPSEKIIDDNYKRIAELEKALEEIKNRSIGGDIFNIARQALKGGGK